MVALVDGAVVAGHRLRSEERQPGDRVPGQLGHQHRRGAGVGPFRLRAPVRPHRQRQQHVPQQHCHLHRRFRHRRCDEGRRHRPERAAEYLLSTRLRQLYEQAVARTEQAVAALWTERLPELAAYPLDAGMSGR
ncbi:hypothetical protein [Streptomyces sp. NPDC055107]